MARLWSSRSFLANRQMMLGRFRPLEIHIQVKLTVVWHSSHD